MRTNQTTNLADSLIHAMCSSGFGFHFYRQSFHGDDLYGLSFFHERIAGRTPIFASHKNFSAARIDRAKRARSLLPTTNAKNF